MLKGKYMNIALVTPISIKSFGGAERKILEAAEFLAKSGNNVTIFALPYTHPHRLNLKIVKMLKEIGVQYCEGKKLKIDADVAYVVYTPFLWRNFKFLCPTIAGLHSPLLFPSKEAFSTFSNPILTIKRYYSLKYAASFWASIFFKNFDLSKFDAVRVLNSCFKVRHKRIYCVPDWVNTRIFKIRSKLKSENFTVLFCGRHHWEKGFDIYLKVATILKRRGYKMRFICTGEGTGPVQGKGFMEDEELARTYSESHLVLYPSRMDTVGGVIIEAAACGTPVITTPILAHLLKLPLFYASNVKEFVESSIKIYTLWMNEREKYYKIANDFHEMAMYYSVDKIFPKFELMLRSVGNKNV